jgi:hypothetical protein
MIEHLPLAAHIPVGMTAGLVAGLIHFATLHRNVELLALGSIAKALAIQGARLGLLLVILFVLAKLGAWALLCGAAGLLAARTVMLRRYRAIAP